jgi:RNA polymerase sigma factor (sigma-70 family)
MKDMIETEITCLIKQAQCGQTRAFDALVHRFQDRAVGYARSILHDSAAAEDAAQEAFVQAWRDLGQLRDPVAFPVWLRRIIFKHCDRVRRVRHLTLVSFDDAFHIDGGTEPATFLESAQNAQQVRLSLETLPEREREVALLYYLGERDLAEIAAFLGIPRTTVKNRLHAARKRLRKELWEMAETILEKEKPSQREVFTGQVLTRILEEYNQQMKADPHTVDQSLLPQGRDELYAVLSQPGSLKWETIQAGFRLLIRQKDGKATASLLMRYLAQSLDDNHTAWVYCNLPSVLALSGDAAGCVLAFEALERWLPGKRVKLSRQWPYEPMSPDDKGKSYEGEKEIYLLVLGRSTEVASAWRGIWRENEYLNKAESALSTAEIRPDNQWLRFTCHRVITEICESSGKFERSHKHIEEMYRIAEEPTGSEEIPESWLARAIGHDIQLRRRQKDAGGAEQKKIELLDLLAKSGNAEWARGERHDLGCQNIWSGQYQQALPLFEQNATNGGQVNSWGYFMYAVAVWKVTGDRVWTLSLLREACVRDERDWTETFSQQQEFAEVREDPEFLKALQKT